MPGLAGAAGGALNGYLGASAPAGGGLSTVSQMAQIAPMLRMLGLL